MRHFWNTIELGRTGQNPEKKQTSLSLLFLGLRFRSIFCRRSIARGLLFLFLFLFSFRSALRCLCNCCFLEGNERTITLEENERAGRKGKKSKRNGGGKRQRCSAKIKEREAKIWPDKTVKFGQRRR